jgi:hypothetical protein
VVFRTERNEMDNNAGVSRAVDGSPLVHPSNDGCRAKSMVAGTKNCLWRISHVYSQGFCLSAHVSLRETRKTSPNNTPANGGSPMSDVNRLQTSG